MRKQNTVIHAQHVYKVTTQCAHYYDTHSAAHQCSPITLLEDMVILVRTGVFSGQEKMNRLVSSAVSPLGSRTAMKLLRKHTVCACTIIEITRQQRFACIEQ